jgi:hypothetical protein
MTLMTLIGLKFRIYNLGFSSLGSLVRTLGVEVELTKKTTEKN